MLTQARAHELLSYDKETGVFIWRVARGNRGVGARAASKVGGYWTIRVDGRRYQATHIAVLLMTGQFPENEIDHKDLNKLNDRWLNLRPATHKQNLENLPEIRADNKSGVRGVHWCKATSKWCAMIGHQNNNRYIGSFDDLNDARAARLKAENELFTHCRRAA